MARSVPFLLLLLAAATFSTASASESPAESADARPAVSTQRDSLDQGAIYRILCGGVTEQDTGLSQHLWAVAGSLADVQWTPPRVTIRVVVSDAEKR